MSIHTDYVTGYYIAEIEFPAPSIVAKDPYGISWFPDIDMWCSSTFGEMDLWGDNPRTGWKRLRNKYFFTSEEKLSWFMLKWSYVNKI